MNIEESFDGDRGVKKEGKKVERLRFGDDKVILGENKKKFMTYWKIYLQCVQNRMKFLKVKQNV